MKKTYTTKQGDMWDSIAYDQLGDVIYTDQLIQANPDYRHYYNFPAGIQLVLPEIRKNKQNTLPPWKHK